MSVLLKIHDNSESQSTQEGAIKHKDDVIYDTLSYLGIKNNSHQSQSYYSMKESVQKSQIRKIMINFIITY